ncbi:MAG TPA: thioredoxin [Dehalococcoidia bacterium]|nr:thioredoxin [Chloroflexota bacterium]HCE76209.1 thioredoxin [Dehalococcoidia bacterium]|tara:strand:+ start:3996 stop:4325 length:330 start_codon:yes stop_codon:yes gene_type:complete
MADTVEITDSNFQEQVLESEIPVLIDFWADWCQPCKMIAPVVQQIADEYEGKIKVGKLDVDSNSQTSMTYNIRGIPALLIFNEGKPVDQIVGAVPKSIIQKKIDDALAG